jgi:Ca2+-binding RTX toxin-like protein
VRTRKARLALCVVAVTALGGVFSSGAYGAIAYTNSDGITIPATTSSPPGDPYPSSINVSGLLGTVGKVTVTLSNVTHGWPDDVDILLTAPNDQGVVLMSDAGGFLPGVTNVDFTFDDAAATSLPDDTTPLSGTFKPSNYEGDNEFLGPAPAGPYGSTLATFTGLDPNGTWNLWAVDDFPGADSGGLSQWTLSLDGPVLAPGTPPPPPPPPPTPAPVPAPLPGACANAQRGTAGNDTLLGTAFGDLLRGLGGADTLRGRRGRDCLNGGTGGDDLFGGRGNDRLVGGPGNDTLACGPGSDVAVVSGPDDFFGCERVRRRR